MDKGNFALISALYSYDGAGLYTDVYMPMIKYTLVSIYHAHKSEGDYYDIEEVFSFVENKFGITIPIIVLQRILVSVEKKGKDITLQTYEKGRKFQIKRAWDTSVNDRIDEMTLKFDQNLEQIEQQYVVYKKKENVEDDKTFVNFISDNAEDILGYFENNNAKNVDGRYSIMAYYLDFLNKSNQELFNAANQLFWGSVVAGFLKRSNPEIDNVNEPAKTEYYLDTALVMALLDLSTLEHKTYADDMLGIIKASSGIARVHPITIKEITNILVKVESQGYPRVNTEIASAFERRKLTAAALAGIRVKLSKLIDELGLSILPNLNENDINKIVHNYKDKTRVKELARQRNYEFYSGDDNFREVHDIFMDDYIRTRRKTTSYNSCSFVTWNTDLITFCRTEHDVMPSMMHPSKIIVEMWMHNAKASTLKNQVLTEALARCMVINNRDVRRKLGIVSKFYNTSSKDYDPEVYKAIILGLYKKAQKVVFYVDEVEDNLLNKKENAENAKLIMKACEEAMAYQKENTSKLNDIQDKIDRMTEDAVSNIQLIRELSEAKKTIEQQLKEASKKTSTISTELSHNKGQLNIERKSRELAEKKNECYQQRDICLEDKRQIEREIEPLEEARRKSFKNYSPTIFLSLGYILSFLAIAVVLWGLLKQKNILPLLAFFVPFAIYCFNRYHNLHNNEEQRQKKAYETWEDKHGNYLALCERLKKVNCDIERLNNEIDSISHEISDIKDNHKIGM